MESYCYLGLRAEAGRTREDLPIHSPYAGAVATKGSCLTWLDVRHATCAPDLTTSACRKVAMSPRVSHVASPRISLKRTVFGFFGGLSIYSISPEKIIQDIDISPCAGGGFYGKLIRVAFQRNFNHKNLKRKIIELKKIWNK